MCNTTSFNSAVEHHHHRDSLKLLSELKSCARRRDLETGAQIHARVLQKQKQLGSPPSIYVWNSLLDMYSKCGSMSHARDVFDNMQARNIASWNTLIRGYAQNGEARLALQLFQEMQQHRGVVPDARTYVAALVACTNLKLLDKGREIHSKLTGELLDNVFVASALVEMYVRCGCMPLAWSVFSVMRERSSACWSSMIAGYVDSGQPLLAFKLYLLMQLDGYLPEARSVVSALKACIALVHIDPGGRAACLRKGGEIHSELVDAGHESLRNVFVETTLVDMYAKCGEMSRSRKVFNEMSKHDAVSWTALMMGYVEDGQNKLALELFMDQMQAEERVVPEARTYVAVFKACASLRWLEKGREIHARAEAEGCVTGDVFVATSVVTMYGKCGCMAEARLVFDRTSTRHRDGVLWTAIMASYVENEQARVALELFTQMQSDGVQTDSQAVSVALNACASLLGQAESGTDHSRLLQRGREIHQEAARTGLDQSDSHVGNSLIDMYSSCGCVSDAQQVFSRMSARTAATWNTMISCYAHNGHPELALETFAWMKRNGPSPDARTYLAAVNACSKLGCLERGAVLHQETAEAGYLSNSHIVGGLVNMYVKCGSLFTARTVLESEAIQPNLFAWTSLVSGYADAGDSELALEMFVKSSSSGLVPDSRMFVAGIKSCSAGAEAVSPKSERKRLWLERGMWLHSLSRKFGCDEQTDPFLASSLVDMYTKCESPDDGLKVFETCVRKQRDGAKVVLWNALITGYVFCGLHTLALGLFTRILSEDVKPNANTLVAAISACSGLAKVEESGKPVKVISLEKGMAVHRQAVRLQLEYEVNVANSLVDMYARCGSLEDAEIHVQRIPHRDVNLPTWNSLIMGNALADRAEIALHLFHSMQRRDHRSFVGALKACVSGAGGLDVGKVVHWTACREGIPETESGGVVTASVIDMYSKCGSMTNAQRVFDSENTRDNLVAWNSLMGGYSHNGDSTRVLELFQSLEEERVQPDGITFLCLLSACAHVGLVDQGVRYMREMSSKYGVCPRIEHFTCMIDMLGRANQLEAAAEVITDLPLQADTRAWRAILAASVKWKNHSLAKAAFQSLVSLCNEDGEDVASAYVLLANMSVANGESLI